MGRYHALALDFDGTLTDTDTPAPAVLAALAEARARGLALVLVTGRFLDHLRESFPGVDACFDALVVENGAVLVMDGEVRPLARPMQPELADALDRRGVRPARGQVILATSAAHARIVLEETTRLGLDVQQVHNRSALMLMPAGSGKGQGLFHALGELGVSYHSTIAVGDAENDHSLLDVCELGVAVANAVPSLRARADVVLSRPAGDGILELLTGPILRGDVCVWPRRWRIELGRADDGRQVLVPATPSRMMIVGASGAGKSYLAGLFAERVLEHGYSICVLDPEGDHDPLAGIRGVTLLSGAEPSSAELGRVLRQRFSSAVFDLSQVPEERKQGLLAEALAEIDSVRRAEGHPHWVLFDEAQLALGLDEWSCGLVPSEATGLCLVTYRPGQVTFAAPDNLDFLIRAELGTRAVLESPATGEPPVSFEVATRRSRHVRHMHKYASAQLPPSRWFHFRAGGGRLTGRTAANLAQFHRELAAGPDDSLGHHARHADFSRWILDALGDETLAAELRPLERRAAADGHTLAAVRRDVLDAVERRYLAVEPR